jgi:hypothetical protein
MASHRLSVSLPIILVGIVACGSAAAQTQVLGPISEETPPVSAGLAGLSAAYAALADTVTTLRLLAPRSQARQLGQTTVGPLGSPRRGLHRRGVARGQISSPGLPAMAVTVTTSPSTVCRW